MSDISRRCDGSLPKTGYCRFASRPFMGLASRRPEVSSSMFAEWLADTYKIDLSGICYSRSGKIVKLPRGRPGWFRLEDVNKQGYPTEVNDQSSLGLWKYWSPNPNDPGVECGAMRSFVTSSGSCSLDLGVPANTHHPIVMIRECYSVLKPEEVSPIDSIWNEYLSATKKKDEAEIKNFITSQRG